MLKPVFSPTVSLSRSEPEGFSRGEERLADAFEHALLVGGVRGDLQDRLSKATQWAEGQVMCDQVLYEIRWRVRGAIEMFLQEGHIPSLFNRAREVADDVSVTFDKYERRVDIGIPTEIRAWLANQTPSMISF